MTSLRERLAAVLFFSDTDTALAAERARNEEARAKATEVRLRHSQEEREVAAKMLSLDHEIKAHREQYAKQAAPMLEEYDAIATAEHYYEEVANTIAAQQGLVEQISQHETQQFGYMSKKLISVGLNFEALRNQIRSGAPFQDELRAALDDAESDDLNVMSSPLQYYAAQGVPQHTVIRASAFDLARAIEETGKAPAQQPVRSWLDLLKFKNAFSPSTVDQNEVRARRKAMEFTRHIESNQLAEALAAAEEASAWVTREKDASRAYFEASFNSFRRIVVPAITADIFLAYASASLNASRYACVEQMLKE